jgi:hypothetical protein
MEDERPPVALGVGHVPGIINEPLEGLIGDRRGVNGEGVNTNRSGRPLSVLRKPFVLVGAHYELPARNPDAARIASVCCSATTRTLTMTLKAWCGGAARGGNVF